ncbi:MAG: nuclear transport factor 2 family protein [Thermoplasmata archaeon]|nr:nuclear transport factor 2 family protein [Thermoplasmata archaeon]
MGVGQQPRDADTLSVPGQLTPEETVRRIIELANRGLYPEALEYYLEEARLELGGGGLPGDYTGSEGIGELIEVAIKEYGRPRVRINELHAAGSKVYVETSTRLDRADEQVTESEELHVFEFEHGKVRRHRIFSNSTAPARLRPPPD